MDIWIKSLSEKVYIYEEARILGEIDGSHSLPFLLLRA
jgi:hypothetical protein